MEESIQENPVIYDNDEVISSYANELMDEEDSNFVKSAESQNNSSQNSENEGQKAAKKKGRPKGSLGSKKDANRITLKPTPSKKVINLTFDGQQNAQAHERLPKMRANVHNMKLTQDQIEQLKVDGKNFYQPGVCFIIAPELHQCIECLKQRKRMKDKREVDCRFYHFRKLRYEGEKLVVAGFLDPNEDPKEIDRAVWLPNFEKSFRFKSMSVAHGRLILAHVGEQLCQIIAKERKYYEKYNSEIKPIIWKRLIDQVIEICDLCSTTLFNYHLICTKCGLSLCIDCANEKNPKIESAQCSFKDEVHKYENLYLTQIIVGDNLDVLQRMLHDVCKLWKIEHICDFKTEKYFTDDKSVENVVFNILKDEEEGETGRTFMTREAGHLFKAVDKIDFQKIPYTEVNNNESNHTFPGVYKHQPEVKHLRPVRYVSDFGSEHICSISRSMSKATSDLFYKDIPHKWLCENKLLRLMDPVNPENERFFHDQWQRGQPVLVSNVLDHLERKHWLPQSFSNEFGKEKSDFINCMNGNLVRNKDISVFWDGFEVVEKRLRDNEGTPMLLKLKDWPPDSDFKKIMPTRFDDIMKNLPMNNYTNRTGDLNIVKYLPQCFIHPDLGPKGYFAYGSPYYLKEGTTNLHLDVSDACNVMCYIGFPRDKEKTIDEYVEQGFLAIIDADCDQANIDRVVVDGEIPGAIWHIFEASDTDKIRDFLLKIAIEKGFKVAKDHDVIHDQNWYLDRELRKRLYKEYGVKGYAIVQCLGDCIILPAGTPHQVRNIYSCVKIAEDFVSPQQMGFCLHLSEEFRKLTKVRKL